MNPDRTAQGSSLTSVHIVCNIVYLRTKVGKRADDWQKSVVISKYLD